MIRYVAYILVTLIALALTGSVAVVLGKGMAESLAGRPVIHVTALDGIGAVGGHPPRIRAVFEGPTGRRPGDMRWAVVRFPQGWTRWAYIGSSGLTRPKGPSGLAPGPHRFQVGAPETRRRLSLVAHGTAWIRPRDTTVLWVDAAAVVPEAWAGLRPDEAAAADPPEVVLGIRDVLKTLAGTRPVVYLVSAEPRAYDVIRRRLSQWGTPAGPAFWVRPGRGYGRLKGLEGVWPAVRGAVIASDDLAAAAERLGVSVNRVPPAGRGDAEAWRRLLHARSSPESTNPQPSEVTCLYEPLSPSLSCWPWRPWSAARSRSNW